MGKQYTSRDVEEEVTCSRPEIGASNIIHALMNFFTMLCSMPCMGMGVWLATGHGSPCLQIVKWPLIAVGLFIFLFSLIGIIGALMRNKFLLWFYLAVVLLIIVALLGIAAFAYAVTRGSGQPLNGKAYEDYYLPNYSNFMQHALRIRGLWAIIKTCIQSENVCQKLNYIGPNKFFNAHLSPLESGCCKPPTACNFKFINTTYWIPTRDANIDNIADCNSWNNDPSKLCYNCDSCRAGVAEDAQRAWSKMALTSAAMIVYMVLNYAAGSCAASNGKSRYYRIRRKVMRSVSKGGASEATRGREHRQDRGRIFPRHAEEEMATRGHCHHAGSSEPGMAHCMQCRHATMPSHHGQHPDICMVCAHR